MKLSQQHILLIADVVLFLLFMGLVILFIDTGLEDAKINYRCAENVVRGNGMVYNAGEFVEGTSCIAWTFALAGLYYLGFEINWAGHFLVLVFSAAFFLMLRHVSRILFLTDSWRARLPLLGIICITYVPASFGNILEGAGVAFVVAMLTWGLVKRNWLIMAIAASSLMPLRPEGPVFAFLIGIWLIFEVKSKRIPGVSMWKYMGVTECALLVLILFRYWYFGDIFPNPVHAKGPAPVDADSVFYFSGFTYLVHYLSRIGIVFIPLSLLALCHRDTRALAVAFLGVFACNLFITGIRGDWMDYYRLLTPYTQLLLLAALLGLNYLDAAPRMLRWAVAAAFVCSLFHAVLPKDISNAWNHFEAQRIRLKRISGSQFNIPKVTLARTLTNFDLLRPDDLVVVQSGGAIGSSLEGVPVIEMYGLTDRKLCTEWPGTQDFQLGGVINWKYVFSRKPTYFAFWWLPSFVHEMSASAENAAMLEDYVVCKGRTYGFHEIMARTDRDVFPMLIYDNGDFCPPRDYLHYPEGIHFADHKEDITPWQMVPWRDENGAHENKWLLWDDNLRVSVGFNLAAGHAAIRKALWDPAPLVLLFGVKAHEPVEARVEVFTDGIRGNASIATLFFSGNDTGRFQVSGVTIAPTFFIGSSELRLEVDTKISGELYIGAYRWSGASPPVLPSDFVRARWENAIHYFAEAGDPISEAIARSALAHFEISPEASVETHLIHQREINQGALPFREKVKVSAGETSACDALDEYYLRKAAPEIRSKEWKALTEWAPQNPEIWFHRAKACFENGEYANGFDAATKLLGMTIGKHPLQERMMVAFQQFASVLESDGAGSSGRPCIQRNDWPSLWHLFNAALSCGPRMPIAVAGIAQSAGYAPESLRMYTLTGLRYPEFQPVYPLMDALCAARYGEHRNQIQWQRFVQRIPGVPFAWLALSKSSERLGDCYEAVTAIRHALKLIPEDEQCLQINERLMTECVVEFAEASLEKGNPADVVEVLVPFLEKHPDNFTALKVLAQAYLAMDRWGDATALYRASIQRNARDYKPFDALSELYVAKGDLAGLLEEWRVFTGNVPESHLGWFCLGLALERNKRHAEAKAAYQRGVSLEPAAAGTLEALARVENLLRQSGGAPR